MFDDVYDTTRATLDRARRKEALVRAIINDELDPDWMDPLAVQNDMIVELKSAIRTALTIFSQHLDSPVRATLAQHVLEQALKNLHKRRV